MHAKARRPRGRRHRLGRMVTAGTIAVGGMASAAGTAVAQVSAEPSADGMPGAALASKIMNWLMWAALMACLGAVLYGAALWRGGTRTGNFARAADGKEYAVGGAVGALIAGVAVTAINTLFAAGRAG